MPRIDPRHWRPLFDAVYEMNTAKDHADFSSAVMAAMDRLIPSDLCIMSVLDRRTGQITAAMSRPNPHNEAEMRYYSENPHQNPLVAYYERTGRTHARRMTDILPLAEWKRHPFYLHCLARLRFLYQLALPVTIDAHTVVALSLDRNRRDFTVRQRTLLDLFGPHFRQAWLRHERPTLQKVHHPLSQRQRLRELGLTLRESDVLFWVAEGKQNREIAGLLGLSLFTVQEYVGNILRKLRVPNRHALTVQTLRRLAGK
ncbi:MAG TPA: helix-turn-helix transcriptional regulator [Opitutus sp.]|nr:helix-turn-helix transcriptional regulator [Opitutus sp.]